MDKPHAPKVRGETGGDKQQSHHPPALFKHIKFNAKIVFPRLSSGFVGPEGAHDPASFVPSCCTVLHCKAS